MEGDENNTNNDQAQEKAPTTGEFRVRTKFNPDNHSVVDQIKQKTAELIDLCEALKGQDSRLAEKAMDGYEDAAMWAVKAATA